MNILGSLIMGLIVGLFEQGGSLQGNEPVPHRQPARGFTTFSAFSHDTLRLLESGRAVISLLNAFGQIAAGLGAVYLGFLFIRLLA